MEQLNDEQLIKCYSDALRFNLDILFLKLLLQEINKRNLYNVMDTAISQNA
jgi:hypothetical protein